jgi:hypothetical protein
MSCSQFERSIGTKPTLINAQVKQSEWNPGGWKLLAKLTGPRICLLPATISHDPCRERRILVLDEHLLCDLN